jgi:hypothetical protein
MIKSWMIESGIEVGSSKIARNFQFFVSRLSVSELLIELQHTALWFNQLMPRSEDEAFRIGNLPDGLNVTASDGPPSAFKGSSQEQLVLHQDVDQFGLAGKIWHRYARTIANGQTDINIY